METSEAEEIRRIVDDAVFAFKTEWKKQRPRYAADFEETQAAFNSLMCRISDQYNVSSTAIYYELALVGASKS